MTSENVFEYFATSMFYDKQSNNQVLRMQTMHTGVAVKDEAAELRWVRTYGLCNPGIDITSGGSLASSLLLFMRSHLCSS